MTDLVVVGGGIVGVSTCYYANRFGADCTLIERDGIASHASGFAFGGLHPRVTASSDSMMPRFAAKSFEEHRLLHRQLESEHGARSTWRPRSSIALAWSEADAHLFQSATSTQASPTNWLTTDAIQKLEPRISREVLGGLVHSESAEVDSAVLAETLHRVASPVTRSDEIVGVEFEHDHVMAVRTSNGDLIEGDAFVFAMGPWSDQAFRWFGLQSTIRPLKGQILRILIDGPRFEHSFSTDGNYMSTKSDGLVWIGTTEEHAGFDESPTEEGRHTISNVLRQMMPELVNFKVVKQTACLRPISLDGDPVVGPISRVSNAYVGTGGGRKGILYGPLMGKYLAELALSQHPKEEWSALRLDRSATST